MSVPLGKNILIIDLKLLPVIMSFITFALKRLSQSHLKINSIKSLRQCFEDSMNLLCNGHQAKFKLLSILNHASSLISDVFQSCSNIYVKKFKIGTHTPITLKYLITIFDLPISLQPLESRFNTMSIRA